MLRLISFFIFILIIQIKTFIFAKENNDTSPFFFLTTENQVKLLSQKLEYRIIDNSSLQIGNLFISTKNLNISLDEKSRVHLEGPLQFMVGGKLIIKDPLGKALWEKQINKISSLTLIEGNESIPVTNQSNQKLRNSSAQYQLGSFEDLQNIVKATSYFNFCIFIETPLSRIQTCSENYTLLYISESKEWKLDKMHESESKNTALVNGTEVNEHGIIQFEKNINSISLAIRLASSLQVEIKAQSVPLELLDIYFEKTNSFFTLKLRDKSNQNPETNTWYSKIPLSDPFLYIEAFAQTPLRQELTIDKAAIPSIEDKPVLLSNNTKSYSEKLSLIILNKKKLKMIPQTKGDSLIKKGFTNQWTLRNLKTSEINEHQLNIESPNNKLLLGILIEKYSSWDLWIGLGQGTQTLSSTQNDKDSVQSYQFVLNKYLDDFFGYNRLRWGLHLGYNQITFAKSKVISVNSNFDFSFRFNENFHHQNNSFSLRMSYLSSQSKLNESNLSLNSAWVGLKLNHDGENSYLTSFLGDYHDFSLGYYPSCLNKYCKNTTLLMSEWQSRYRFLNSYYWSWSIGYQESNTSINQESIKATLIQGHLGFGFEF